MSDQAVPEFTPKDVLQLVVSGAPALLVPTLKKTPGIDMGCRPMVSTLANGVVQAACFVPASSLAGLQGSGLTVQVQRNASADSRARQAEVLRELPAGAKVQGMGTSHLAGAGQALISNYLDTDVVEFTLGNLAAQYPTLCQRITLPHQTVQRNTITMLRVGKQGTSKARGVLMMACAHAREWGGAEICLNLLMDLMAAYTAGGTITYGGVSYSAAQVAQVIETVDLFVLPCVNPDGRIYSMTSDPLWRKNRNGPGVDLNRNYDFVWNFDKAFDPRVAQGTDPSVYIAPASDDPSNDLYHGTAPTSELECQNVVWVLDSYPSIGWLVDIHSYTGDCLYSWGNSPDQTTIATENFLNPAFDGKRGVPDADVYGEYLPEQDLLTVQGAAEAMNAAIVAVRGQNYEAHQDYDLKVAQNQALGYYPTSGAVDDYSYSRHFANSAKPRIYGFTIEFGVTTDFHPPFPEMGNIIEDIDAGLMAFCLYKVNPCAALEQELADQQAQIESYREAIADGEIPEPRTPANLAAVHKELIAMTQKAAKLAAQLARCQAGQT